MINEMLTRSRRFSLKFCETVFQSSDRHCGELFNVWLQEVAVFAFAMIGLIFVCLCVLSTLSSSVREPSI